MQEVSDISVAVRSARLATGKCPRHGGRLVRKGPLQEDQGGKSVDVGVVYGCTVKDCPELLPARAGSRAHKMLRK